MQVLLRVALPIIDAIVQQHIDEAASLYARRLVLVSGPHMTLFLLARQDERMAAHLDGLAVAGARASSLHDAKLAEKSAAALFVATACAIEDRDEHRLVTSMGLAETVQGGGRAVIAAFGWFEPDKLRGIVVGCLQSELPSQRLVGIGACSMHCVDPGLRSGRCLEDPDAAVRARTWRTAGELGMFDLRSVAAGVATNDSDPGCQFWAAWSAVLLGGKGEALDLLRSFAIEGPQGHRALQLSILAMRLHESHVFLSSLAQDSANIRRVIRGAGISGDPTYVPWLISCMANDPLARLAGESFSVVTGLDLACPGLERKPPENFKSGPSDDPNDPHVEMDEDEGLPWPDQAKIQAWWQANAHRFQPGVRYFMGEPVNKENCLRVLKEGFQRQRILAAHYLCLLNPGTVLFNTNAPAWRQQRLLAQMS